MTRRRLTPDETALWQRVARTTERLRPARPVAPSIRPEAPDPPLLPDARFGPVETGQNPERPGLWGGVLSGFTERPAEPPLRMDSKAHSRLKRGKLAPEARLDLHGMTLDQAHPALTGFILREHARGRRLLLVITGKGKARDEGGPIPTRAGVLRRNVPHWLSRPPLAQAVLHVAEAHLRHGGGGAFYVYLRKGQQ